MSRWQPKMRFEMSVLGELSEFVGTICTVDFETKVERVY